MTQEEQTELNKKEVLVYYCACGKSIEAGGDPETINKDRALKKEYRQAKEWGRKVETITLEEYHKLPFMCLTKDGKSIEGCVKH